MGTCRSTRRTCGTRDRLGTYAGAPLRDPWDPSTAGRGGSSPAGSPGDAECGPWARPPRKRARATRTIARGDAKGGSPRAAKGLGSAQRVVSLLEPARVRFLRLGEGLEPLGDL